MRYCLQHSCLQSHLPGPALAALQRRGCWHSGPSARPLTRLAAKRSATREAEKQQAAEAPQGDPRDCFTGYEPVDSEGNPWWEPPNRDFFEGGAWEWLGKGASFVLPVLFAFAIASGTFAAANYMRGPAPPELAQPDTKSAQNSGGDNLDFLLSEDKDEPLAPF